MTIYLPWEALRRDRNNEKLRSFIIVGGKSSPYFDRKQVFSFCSTDRWSHLANTGTAGCQHQVAEEYHPSGNACYAG